MGVLPVAMDLMTVSVKASSYINLPSENSSSFLFTGNVDTLFLYCSRTLMLSIWTCCIYREKTWSISSEVSR